MNGEQEIAYITCVNNEEMYAACREALAAQALPEGMRASFVPIRGAASMCAGYQEAQEASHARYKLYIHQDCILQRCDVVLRMLSVCAAHPDAGLVGLAGCRQLPETGMWWLGEGLYYHVAEEKTVGRSYHRAGTTHGQDAAAMAAVDGLLLLTAVDVPWRSDIFQGWHFYDISMCLEMRWRGYGVYVPCQEGMDPWVLHRCGDKPITEEYHRWRRLFLYSYGKTAEERKLFSVTAAAGVRSRLSVCYIVRDCQEELALSLSRLQGEPDEIIVVDTGSEDDTAAVAQSFGAEVFHETWRDDFAAARNVALARATGDWVLVLDADEHLAPVHDSLHHVVARAAASGTEGLMAALVNVDLDCGGREMMPEPVLRLWRNRPGRRYVRGIHEEIADDGRPLAPLGRAEGLVLRHTGYSAARVKEKLARNLVFLQRQIERHGETSEDWRYLADCFYGLEEYALALHYAECAIKRGAQVLDGNARMYEVAISSLARLARPTEERLEMARRAVTACPEVPGFAREVQSASLLLAAERWYAAQDAAPATDFPAAVEAYIAQADRPEERRSFLAAWAQQTGRVRLSLVLAACSASRPAATLAQEAVTRGAWPVATICQQAALGRRTLFRALYALSGTRDGRARLLSEEWPKRLPETFERIVYALCLLDHEDVVPGRGQLMASDYVAWARGLSMLETVDAAGLQRYARLATGFAPDWGCLVRAAGDLLAREAWAAALSLLSLVPAQAAEMLPRGVFWYRTGIALYELREDGAAECFERATAAGGKKRSLSAYQGQRHPERALRERLLPCTPRAWWRLGRMAERRHQEERAYDCYLSGLRSQPRHRALLCCLLRLLRRLGMDDVGQIQLLQQLYRPEDWSWLAAALERFSAGAVYLYFARAAGMSLDTAEAQMAAGRADAAAEQAATIIDTACQFGLLAEAEGAVGLDSFLGDLPQSWQRAREDWQERRQTPETCALTRLACEMKEIIDRRMS